MSIRSNQKQFFETFISRVVQKKGLLGQVEEKKVHKMEGPKETRGAKMVQSID